MTTATTTMRTLTLKTGTWTVQNTNTGEHRTFRITRERSAEAKFAPGRRLVELLTGPNNQSDFEAFGFASDDTITVWGKFRGELNRPSAHDWFASMLAGLLGGRAFVTRDWSARGYTVRGEAWCCVCGRALTNPESQETGIGPVCAGRGS